MEKATKRGPTRRRSQGVGTVDAEVKSSALRLLGVVFPRKVLFLAIVSDVEESHYESQNNIGEDNQKDSCDDPEDMLFGGGIGFGLSHGDDEEVGSVHEG
jgi:hypothetical protein